MAILLNADGRRLPVAPLNRRSFTIREVRAIVRGHVEAVYLPNGLVMFVNEEGKLEGLPRNAQATSVAAGVIQPGDYIAGDALVVSMKEAGEEEDEE
jgi:hypothetical protein